MTVIYKDKDMKYRYYDELTQVEKDYLADKAFFEIFEKMCKQDDYELAWEVVEKMKNIFVEKINDDVKNFANGRFVRNVYEDMVMNHARRVEKIINPSLEQLKQFPSEDVPAISRRV